MNSALYKIFSDSNELSSGRIGHFIGLITVVFYTGYDTYMNKRLDFALAGLLLGAGTTGFALTKNSENLANSNPEIKG
jgi:hypothetical protein